MKQLYLLLMLLCMAGHTYGQATFATADTMGENVVKSGTLVASAPDHYYKTVLQGNGLLRLIFTSQNTGSIVGGLRLWVYLRNQAAVQNKQVFYNPSAGATNDTLLIGGLAGDTVYFRMEDTYNAQPYNYTLKYQLLGVTASNETQPNETIATAQNIPINTSFNGNISFYSIATGVDIDDYYSIVLPKSGTVKLYASYTNMYTNSATAPTARVYVHSKYGTPEAMYTTSAGIVGYATIANQGSATLMSTYQDTITLFARADDTMYVHLYNYHSGLGAAWCGTYSLQWNMADTSNTTELNPNNTIAQAQPLVPGATVNGDISYRNAGGVDLDDYYRIILDRPSTIKLYVTAKNTYGYYATSPSPIIYGVLKNGNLLSVRSSTGDVSTLQRVRNNGSLPFLSSITDTMHICGVANDTFYVDVYNYHTGAGYNWAAQYSLRYELSDTVRNEVEPNNTLAEAQLIVPGQVVKGHVNYSSTNALDISDYFKIVKPHLGSIRLYIKGKNTFGYSPTAGALQVFAYNKTGNLMLVNSATGASWGAGLRLRNNASLPYESSIADTMTINCIPDDTMYVMLQNYFNFQYGGNASTYEFYYEYIQGPEAHMDYARTGSEFGFSNLSAHATNYLWQMGNNLQYTSYYPPMTTYVPGFYTAKLIAYDNICNYSDTDAVSFTIAGVEHYSPQKAGQGGDAVIDVYGGGLNANTQFKLVNANGTLLPVDKYTNSKQNHLTVMMDLHQADTGWYDVVVEVPGLPPVTYTNGFHIEAFKYPYAWSQVVAAPRWRTNTSNPFTLVVGNNGNVAARGVVVAMAWPKTVNISWPEGDYKPDYNLNDTLVDGATTYVFPNSMYRYIYDSINAIVPIDTLDGKAYDGYIRYMFVPVIPAQGTWTIPFVAQTLNTGPKTFVSYTLYPNLFGSCTTDNVQDVLSNMNAELNKTSNKVQSSNQGLFGNLSKSLKIPQKHLINSVKSIEKGVINAVNEYEDSKKAPVVDFLKQTSADGEFNNHAIEQADPTLINNGQMQSMFTITGDQVKIVTQDMAKNAEMAGKEAQKYIDQVLNGPGSGSQTREQQIDGMFDKTKSTQKQTERENQLDARIQQCPDLEKQREDLKKNLQDELTHQDKLETPTTTAVSFDPNAIYGPSGIDQPRYISDFKRQPFAISFENVDTATADAQVVMVNDTIDKTKFDIASVAFEDITIGTQRIRVPKGRQEFTLQTKLANTPGMYVRINASVDTLNGIISWLFSSVDSATLNRPLLHGFLPPNVNKPDGEGQVSYLINPLNTLPDATVLNSTATIIFDDNAPITTSPWSNQLDIAPPSSSVTNAVTFDDTVMHLYMTGSDASSGINKYRLFYATNNGSWKSLGTTSADSMVVIGQRDSSYSFYCEAIDKVGNEEHKSAQAEVTVALTSVQNVFLGSEVLNVYPNPATDLVNVQVYTSREEQISLSLTSVTGQQIATLYEGKIIGRNIIACNLRHVSSGVYYLRLTSDKGKRQVAKLVLTR